MKVPKTLLVTTREAWRAWLEARHDAETEIWLVYHKRHTKRPRIAYADAVEEALCFGWIDSVVRRRPRAWRNFTAFAPSYRRLYVRWIEAAVRQETRERRLAEATARLLENRKLGLK